MSQEDWEREGSIPEDFCKEDNDTLLSNTSDGDVTFERQKDPPGLRGRV